MNEEIKETTTEETKTEEAKTEEKKEKPHLFELVYEWLEVFIISVAAVFVIFSFVARIAVVDGGSMLPTLTHGDKLVVRQLFYTPEQGDIIVCQSEAYGLDKPLVKRIIATEGQTVRLDRENWIVYVNGYPLEESAYILKEAGFMIGWDYSTDEITVPEGHVFVMGDHRNDSLDSRSYAIGMIDERYIIGEVIFRFMPFNKLGPVN